MAIMFTFTLYYYVIHVFNETFSKANKIINETIEKDGIEREREREAEKERERER